MAKKSPVNDINDNERCIMLIHAVHTARKDPVEAMIRCELNICELNMEVLLPWRELSKHDLRLPHTDAATSSFVWSFTCDEKHNTVKPPTACR